MSFTERIFGNGSNLNDRFIPDLDKLVEKVEHLRGLNARIVLTMGTFDMIHIGHMRYCERARESGDVLIVGVDSDEKVKKRKGEDRPIYPEDECIEGLAHLRHVDIITLKDSSQPRWHLIRIIAPDVLIATKETYKEEEIQELEKICGSVVVLESQARTSTSAKIRKLQVGVLRPAIARIRDELDNIEGELE